MPFVKRTYPYGFRFHLPKVEDDKANGGLIQIIYLFSVHTIFLLSISIPHIHITMAATRRSCARLSTLLPSSSNALFLASRAQLPRVTARITLSKRAGVAALPLARTFINDARQSQTATEESESLAPKIDRSRSKVFKSADEAVADIKSGSTILSAGFGLCGTAGKDTLTF